MLSVSRRDALSVLGSSLPALIAGCLSSSCRTRSPEVGHWEQIGHDAQHTGGDTSLAGVTAGADHWRITHDSAFRPKGVAVTGERVLVCGRRRTEQGFRGFLCHRSLTDGELRRRLEIPTPVIAPPVVSGEGVIVTCRIDGDRACYRCVNFDGEKRWTRELGGPVLAPPTVSRGTVYGGGPNGRVVALDASDGALQWERQFGDERQEGAIYGSVSVDQDRVYVPVSSSKERGVYALSRDDGRIEWDIPGPRIQSTMVRTGNRLLVSYPRYALVAFDSDTGERRWSRSLATQRISPPAAGGDRIVISDTETLYGLDGSTGEERWSVDCSPNPGHQPVIAGDTVIVQSEAGLVGCSLSAGERRWTIDSGSSLPIVPFENGFLYSPEPETLAAYTSCRNE